MAEWNFTIKQGATFRREIAYGSNGTPINLTGHTFRMQVRSGPSLSSTLLADWTMGSGLTLNAPSGILLIEIDESVTALFNFDVAYHDLLHIYPDGFADRDLRGEVTLLTGITEP